MTKNLCVRVSRSKACEGSYYAKLETTKYVGYIGYDLIYILCVLDCKYTFILAFVCTSLCLGSMIALQRDHGTVKIGNDHYVNLGMQNISYVHACSVVCSVHEQLELIDGCNKHFP